MTYFTGKKTEAQIWARPNTETSACAFLYTMKRLDFQTQC